MIGAKPKGGKRADLGNIYFRSAWEANYARYLNWMLKRGEIREWQHEPCTFWFEGIKRGTRSYLPDFLVIKRDHSKEFHEVKGFLDRTSATKLKRMKKHYPNIKIVVIQKDFMQSLNRELGKIIPNWE